VAHSQGFVASSPRKRALTALWPAQIACPNCDGSVGSVALVGTRIKMLLKSMTLAWRATPHVRKDDDDERLGLSIQVASLASQFGLPTHTRKQVIDGVALSKALEAKSTPALTLNQDSETDAVRTTSSEGGAWTASPAIRSKLLGSDAVRAVVGAAPKDVGVVLYRWLQLFEADERARKSAAATTTTTTTTTEDAEVDAASEFFRRRRERLVFIASNHFSPKVSPAGAPMAAKALDDVLKLMQNRAALELVPARVLCGAALAVASRPPPSAQHQPQQLQHLHAEATAMALQNVVDELASRKEELGPVALAFGRSADMLRQAVALSPSPIARVEDAIVEHPVPGAVFGVPEVLAGLTKLACAHEGCEARPTHGSRQGPKYTRGQPMPEWCHLHAPEDAVRLVEPPAHTQRRQSYSPTRKRQAMVDVPDPAATAMAPMDASFFPLKVSEANVVVTYESEQAAMVAGELESLCSHAEELFASGLPSMQTAVGIDVEWRPWFSLQQQPNPTSIVQIATRDKVYIIDVINQGSRLASTLRRLLQSSAVVKLGHGLGEDLFRLNRGLANALNDASFSVFPVPSVLELAPLYAAFKDDKHDPLRPPSLARMVKDATGLELNKQCQMTDWERRPLSPAQVQYAAIDALCAFTVFDVFAAKAVGPGLKHESIGPLLSEETARESVATGDDDDDAAAAAVAAGGTAAEDLMPPRSLASSTLPRPSYRASKLLYTRRGEDRMLITPREARTLLEREHDAKQRLVAKGVRVDDSADDVVPLDALLLAEEELENAVKRAHARPTLRRESDGPQHALIDGAGDDAHAKALGKRRPRDGAPAALRGKPHREIDRDRGPAAIEDQLLALGFDAEDARKLRVKLMAEGFKTRQLVLAMDRDDMKACGFSLGQMKQLELGTGRLRLKAVPALVAAPAWDMAPAVEAAMREADEFAAVEEHVVETALVTSEDAAAPADAVAPFDVEREDAAEVAHDDAAVDPTDVDDAAEDDAAEGEEENDNAAEDDDEEEEEEEKR